MMKLEISFKRESSEFAWQEGYAAFSVSCSQLDNVSSYIANQAAHHRRMSFEAEYLELLKGHGIEHDDRWALD